MEVKSNRRDRRCQSSASAGSDRSPRWCSLIVTSELVADAQMSAVHFALHALDVDEPDIFPFDAREKISEDRHLGPEPGGPAGRIGVCPCVTCRARDARDRSGGCNNWGSWGGASIEFIHDQGRGAR